MNRILNKNWLKNIKNKFSTQENEKKLENVPKEATSEIDDEALKSIESQHVAIGRMAAFFAHEIRNPLTSVIGFSQYLEQNPTIKSDPNTAHYVSIIKEEALRMEILIQELLNLSKTHLNQDNLSIIDVKSSVEKIVDIYSLQSEKKNIKINATLKDELYITGNTYRFERLIINFIKNAIEAIEQEGLIEVRVGLENKFVVISIIDSGPGIPPEQLEQIFIPFYTTKDAGTGIGIPICKTIVETMNGTLTIKNHSSKGLHVKIKIPQSQHSSYKS